MVPALLIVPCGFTDFRANPRFYSTEYRWASQILPSHLSVHPPSHRCQFVIHAESLFDHWYEGGANTSPDPHINHVPTQHLHWPSQHRCLCPPHHLWTKLHYRSGFHVGSCMILKFGWKFFSVFWRDMAYWSPWSIYGHQVFYCVVNNLSATAVIVAHYDLATFAMTSNSQIKRACIDWSTKMVSCHAQLSLIIWKSNLFVVGNIRIKKTHRV